jgi:hypothetical protein
VEPTLCAFTTRQEAKHSYPALRNVGSGIFGRTSQRRTHQSHRAGYHLAVTVFADFAAPEQRLEVLSLAALAELARTTTARAKEDLPWLKLARFRSGATPRGSLRHDRNVICITGVEGDYDGGVVAFDEGGGAVGEGRVAGAGLHESVAFAGRATVAGAVPDQHRAAAERPVWSCQPSQRRAGRGA